MIGEMTDRECLFAQAIRSGIKLTSDEIEQFCDRVAAAVQRDDEPRWVAREFEFKVMMGVGD